MVMYKGESCKAEDLRRFVKDNYPSGTIVITRKPANTGAVIICGETGKVLEKGRSNFDLVRRVTDPNTAGKKGKTPRLIEIPPVINIKTHAENQAIKALCYLIELTEVTGENKPRVVCDDNGTPTKIKLGVLEYDLNGIRGE